MSKNISISDDVYRKLKREKGERSFSELIEDHLESGGTLADVTGQEIFERGTYDAVKDDIRGLSDGTFARIDDETP
jgi:predicted CopG family antitoxin